MNILHYATHATPAKRHVLALLAMVVTLTSTNVQAAAASEVLPEAPAWVTDSFESDETTQGRGIVVPVSGQSVSALPVAPAAIQTDTKIETKVPAKPVNKKKWNTINSADLDIKAEHSTEPALRTMTVATTAYNSEPGQTDSSPFTTANGTRVYDGVIAANFLKFGTRVRIPDHFGDKVFVVHDRMNARYTQRVDIWMTNKSDAFKWGVRRVKIEVLP